MMSLYLRNGADALMRQLLSTFGISGLFWIGGIFLFCIYILYFIQKYSWEEYEIKSRYFISMVFRKPFMVVFTFFLMSNMHLILMTPSGFRVYSKCNISSGSWYL